MAGLVARASLALGGFFARAAKYMDDLSPFAPQNERGWGMVRGAEPASHRREGQTVRLLGFEKNPVVYACMRVIADQVAGAHLEEYSIEKNGATKLYPDGQLQALLDQPAPQVSGFKFRRLTALQYLNYGNSYWALMRGDRGSIARLRNVHPERMQQIIIDPATDEIRYYLWQDSTGVQRITPWFDMLHAADLSLDPDGWFGAPRALAALADIVTDGEASQYVRQVLNNAGVPALVLFGRQGTQLSELQAAESAWHHRMTQGGERGRTRFLGGIESLQVIGHSLKDLEFPSLRQVTREAICAVFGVDPRLISVSSAKGQEGGLSGSQYQEARRRLEQQTCAPIRTEMQEALDTTVTPEFGYRYARYSPAAIAAIIETPTERAQRSGVLVASGIATLDEARAENGLPEAMNPKHVVMVKMLQTVKEALEANEREATQAVNEIKAAATAKGVAKGQSPSEAIGGPSGVTATDNDSNRALNAPVSRQAPPPSRLRLAGAPDLTQDEESVAWQAFDDRARALEPALEETARRAVEEMRSHVLHALARSSEDVTIERTRAAGDAWWTRFLSGLSSLFGDDGAIRRLWLRFMSARITAIATDIAEEFAEEAGREFNAADPKFEAGLRKRLGTLARSVTETAGRRIIETVQAARGAGASAPEVAGLIRDMDFEGLVRRVARTESVGLLNHAERMAAEQLGTLRRKRWLSQRDGLVRESHRHCDGAGWIDIGSAFPNGLQYPHDPNGSADEVDNCRCGAMYSDRDNET